MQRQPRKTFAAWLFLAASAPLPEAAAIAAGSTSLRQAAALRRKA
jgi:hypothetical protein